MTEQYPKAFGGTVAEVGVPTLSKEDGFRPIVRPGLAVFPKTQFSMFTEEVDVYLSSLDTPRQSFILCGIETHICVQQTALHLLEKGFQVHIVADGVSSSHRADRNTALDALRQAGAFVTSTESVLFELMRDSTHPSFKEMSRVISTPRVDPFE